MIEGKVDVTQPDLTLERIMQVATGAWATSLLATGVVYSIFTHIATGHDTLEDIARKAAISQRGAGALLDGLVGLGFLSVSDGRYRNAPDASEFLVEGKPSYFGGFPKVLFGKFSERTALPEAARTGQPAAQETTDAPENPFWEQLVPAIAV